MSESRYGRGEFFKGDPFDAIRGVPDPAQAEQILLDLASTIEADVNSGILTQASQRKAKRHIADILDIAIQVSS